MLQTRFEQRESRDEDLQAIAELQQRVIALTKDRKQALEDLKFYKLELINREENYNKTFGRSPIVGVMQLGKNANRASGTLNGTMMGGVPMIVASPVTPNASGGASYGSAAQAPIGVSDAANRRTTLRKSTDKFQSCLLYTSDAADE